MIAKVLQTAGRKIPWKVILATLPHIRDLLDGINKLINNLRPGTREAIEALRDTLSELSGRVQELGSSTQILAARVTLALILAGVSLVVGVAGWLFVLSHGR